ncbi:hypothetical protein ES703_64646 [subsurface metagenome]
MPAPVRYELLELKRRFEALKVLIDDVTVELVEAIGEFDRVLKNLEEIEHLRRRPGGL